MKNKFRLAGLLAALGLLSLAAGPASASIISFGFYNEGKVTDAQGCGPNCLRVTTSGQVEEILGLAGANSWTFHGVMEFALTGWGTLEGDGTGAGLGWSFIDDAGVNNLFGSFSSTLDPGVFSLGGETDYVINGGSGVFAGASGVGFSLIAACLNGTFYELGWMRAVTPSSVPEPGTIGLLFAGLGMVGFMAWRRRRAFQQG